MNKLIFSTTLMAMALTSTAQAVDWEAYKQKAAEYDRTLEERLGFNPKEDNSRPRIVQTRDSTSDGSGHVLVGKIVDVCDQPGALEKYPHCAVVKEKETTCTDLGGTWVNGKCSMGGGGSGTGWVPGSSTGWVGCQDHTDNGFNSVPNFGTIKRCVKVDVSQDAKSAHVTYAYAMKSVQSDSWLYDLIHAKDLYEEDVPLNKQVIYVQKLTITPIHVWHYSVVSYVDYDGGDPSGMTSTSGIALTSDGAFIY